MLVGGTTGSGKTVFLYSILTCFLKRFDPEEFRLAIVDPKLTNFMFCNQLPNLEHGQVITESQDAADLFEWITEEGSRVARRCLAKVAVSISRIIISVRMNHFAH
jgi:DNA segregation ATPase FtsK/SpoIIIE-like protein